MTVPDLFSTPSSRSAADFGKGMRRAWRIIWRGKHLVLAIIGLALLPAILYIQQAPKLYTAEAKIVIQAPETNDVLSEKNAVNSFRLTEEVIQTEVELISSTMLARRTVDRLGLDNDPEFNRKLRTPKPLAQFFAALNPLNWVPESWQSGGGTNELSPEAKRDIEKARITRSFLKNLKVKNQRRTYMVVIQFSSESREKAALIANTIAEVYVLDRLEASFSEARQVSSWLGDRLKSLQQDAVAAETAVERFRSQNDLRRTSERSMTVGDQQLSELNSRLVLARTELAQKQARLQQVRALTKARGGYETSSDVLQSQLIQRLREQEAIRSREMSEALKTYGERHPRIIGLRADLDDLQAKIGGEIDKIAVSIANEVAVSSAGVASLERELGALRQQTNVAGETAVRLRDLERQAEASRSLYETFLVRFKREAEQANMRRANARVVSAADVPLQSSAPATVKILAAVILVSTCLSVMVVFLLDSLDNTIRSSDDAEEMLGLPVHAVIPHQGKAAARPLEEMLGRPHSALVDSIRGLRTALVTGEGGDTGHVIMMTSSVPKEGKTFVSLCLTSIFSRTEDRVLLIDSDVYRPRLHSVIGVSGERGLVEVLSGECAFDDVVQKGVAKAFDFLPAGRSAHLAELLQGDQFDTLMEDLKRRYSRIIIDSPPVLAVADVRLLARQVDKVIYLVKWGGPPRDGVRNGVKLLRAANVPLSGIVLSQVNQRKHAQYGYGDYGQYYGRYSDYYGK